MTKALSSYSKKIFMMLAALVIIFLVIIFAAASANAAEVFDPATFTHNDTLDTYDNAIKINSAFGPYINMENHSSTYTRQYGGYITTGEEHLYSSLRLILNNAMPNNYLSVYADPGVDFVVLDANGNEIINTATSSMNSTEVLFGRTTTYSGGIFHLYQLKEYASGTNSSDFYIEFTTNSTDDLHYSLWYGCPLFAESRTLMYVPTRSISKPTTTSTAVTTTTTTNAVPANSWIKSIYYTVTYQANPSFMALRYDSVRVPDKTSYQRILAGNTYNFTLNSVYAAKAQGTYFHRFESVMWSTGTTTGSTYSNMATCYVEYYYVFGRGDTPYYQ